MGGGMSKVYTVEFFLPGGVRVAGETAIPRPKASLSVQGYDAQKVAETLFETLAALPPDYHPVELYLDEGKVRVKSA